MIIDSHGHVTAPDSLCTSYKAQILAHRGAHGRGGDSANDEDVRKALNAPVFGGSSHIAQLQEVGTDLQLISPRPYQMMTSENPRLVQWFVRDQQHHRQAGPALSRYLPRRVRVAADAERQPGGGGPLSGKVRQGFGICRLSPQPGSGRMQRHRNAAARRPLLVSALREAGRARLPGHIHSAGCRSERLPYSLHFINEENIAVVSLLNSQVFNDFPTLKILVSHGGGAIRTSTRASKPARCAARGRFSDQMRKLYYDTVLYRRTRSSC